MMKTETQREEELFDAARKLTGAAACRAFLDQACHGDSSLRARIEDLLRDEQEAEEFFAETGSALSLPVSPVQFTSGTPPAAAANRAHGGTVPGEEPVGTRIGRYKLLQKIGEGGWGVVYLA